MMKACSKAVLACLLVSPCIHAAAPSNPILYVTQTPMPDELLTHVVAETKMGIASTMQSPLGGTAHAARGGALWIRYANGQTRNLTEAAGYGGMVDDFHNAKGFQGVNGIAVHRPVVHWSGTKAIFSMVVGAPASAADATVFHWQLYEITNFASNQTPVITPVSGQPTNYNNIEACYDTQDRIVFVSDAPLGLQAHLYPQLDEYMNVPCNTGLWRLDRDHGNELKHLVHTPSGAFTPFIDSEGRILFVQWDHLSRDTAAVYDRVPSAAAGETWTQTFNGNGTFASEALGAPFTLGTTANYSSFNNYPEPRNFDKSSLNALVNVTGNSINQFFPWECHEDGSAHEIINHVGRHEFGGSNLHKSLSDDSNLVDPSFSSPTALDMLHLIESPTVPGTFYAVNPPEFGTHMAGGILRFSGGTAVNPGSMKITYVTPNASVPNPALNQTPLTNPVDIYRNPLPLTDGGLLAVHAPVQQYDSNKGADAQHPLSRYDFRLRMLTTSGSNMIPDSSITLVSPTSVDLNYYTNGTLITYTGALWELDPVEVVARTPPSPMSTLVASVEQAVFSEEGVDLPTFKTYLKNRNLAVVVNRNSTRRDAADKQQPYNLKVSWSATQTLGTGGKIYDIGWVQMLQADAIRGFTHSANANASPQPGRRTLPVPMHDVMTEMPPAAGAPAGAVKIGTDGSWAAVLPAGRALTWHMMNGSATKSQVKERYWVSFAPGEVRTCAVCHGVNTVDQAGNTGVPTNKPNALRELLQYWKSNNPPGSMQHKVANTATLKTAGTASLLVSRTGGSTGPVTVNFSLQGTAVAGVDYTAPAATTLTWLDGDTDDKAILLPLLNPSAIGAARAVTATLSNPVNGSLGGQTAATLTIQEPPFQSWLFNMFGSSANTAAVAGDTADPDHDGRENLLEYALGSNPNSAAAASGFTTGWQNVGGVDYLTLSYVRDLLKTDIVYQVESSPDLAAGHWSPVGDSATGTAGSLETRQASVPVSAGATFLRLRVTRIP